MACKTCRSRKIKCDRTRPVCQNCRLRSTECTYAGERRTKHWIRTSSIDARRFSVIRNDQGHHQTGGGPPATRHGREIIVRHETDAMVSKNRLVTPTASDLQARPDGERPDIEMAQRHHQPQWSQMEPDDPMSACGFDQMPNNDTAMPPLSFQTPTSSGASESESLLDRILQGDDGECTKDRNPALWMRASDGDEYTGPSSGISTISDLGLSWVRQNVADSAVLCETIQDIRNGVISHLRQPKCIPQGFLLALATPVDLRETPDAVLRGYVDTYFDTVQVIFPILDRGRFLSQLETLGTGPAMSTNPSWQALLSAVLASGCRASLSAETAEAFKESGRQAWGYFLHALSFESRILHGSTDLMAVQAMAVMTVFAQGLSSPQRLEYTLSSIASRLAQSLALNRYPAPEWHLTEYEKQERNRVFWVIYCLDRLIALRCGRPAVISDDDVSCCFPRGVIVLQNSSSINHSPGSAAADGSHVDFFLCLTKLARICGKVSRLLYSASALYSPSPRLLPTLNRLLQDLHSWLDLLPAPVRPGKPPNRMRKTFGLSRDQVTMIHLSYYYVLCAIYRRFTPIFTQDSKNLQHLVNNDMHVSHIEAARSMVLLTKHLDIESFTPAWLVFYYPFTALTTIFVHIVSNPPNASTQSDIALMETVVGFFGRLEYVTSGEAAFTKTTEFVRQARNMTNRYAQDANRPHNMIPDQVSSNSSSIEVAVLRQGHVDAAESRQMQTADSSQLHPEVTTLESGKSSMIERTPPTTEPLQDGEGSDRMNRTQQDQSMYSDLVGLLAPPAEDGIHVNWLDDWVSAI